MIDRPTGQLMDVQWKEVKGRKVFEFPFDKKPMSGNDVRRMELARQANPRVTPTEVFEPKTGEVVAQLDAATQLPATYTDGSTLRSYTFQATPDTPLHPSGEILKFLRARAAILGNKLTTPPGP